MQTNTFKQFKHLFTVSTEKPRLARKEKGVTRMFVFSNGEAKDSATRKRTARDSSKDGAYGRAGKDAFCSHISKIAACVLGAFLLPLSAHAATTPVLSDVGHATKHIVMPNGKDKTIDVSTLRVLSPTQHSAHLVQTQIKVPSIWVFAPYVQTVGQAVVEILKTTPYRLKSHLPGNIVKKFSVLMPNTLRQFGPMTAQEAIRHLTGEDIHIIANSVYKIVNGKKVTTPIQKYFQLQGFTQRVAYPLTLEGLKSNPTTEEVKAFNKKHSLYFSFNRHDKLVGIASSQKMADALANKERGVFFAIAGQTLKTTVERWAKEAGYKVFWSDKVRNMNLAMPAPFFGTFHHSGVSVLHKIFIAVLPAGISARDKFFTNGAVKIIPMRYKASSLNPPTTKQESQ